MKIITRRKFLKYSALASTSLLIPNFLKGLQASEVTRTFASAGGGKKLVIVQLSGGNDGLNTVIPFKNDLYYSMRKNLAIGEKDVFKMTDDLGLNPGMEKFKALFDNGNLSIINSVGYPNPDRSHFRSMDIWQSGSSSQDYINSGWLGRYLDSECEGCANPHHAIEVSESLSLALKGESRNGLAVQDPRRFFYSSAESFFSDVSRMYQDGAHSDEHNVEYLYKTVVEAMSSAEYVYKTSKIYSSKQEYPNGEFGKNLKTIAELIISGIETSVFYVTLSGFDTHANQKGRQENLLTQLSEGLYSFTQDLRKNNMLDDTLIFSFSEFGRRVSQNASGGTDHGTANNVFLIGGNLAKPGFYNPAPDLTDLDNGDLKYQIDFRDVYTTLLNKWLGSNAENVLGGNFNNLKII